MNKWLDLLQDNDYMGVKKYIRDGADISLTNEIGESVLSLSLRYRCDNDIVMLLIESGADLFDFDDEGVSIFDNAIIYNNIDLVEYLLKQGINVNSTTRRSRFTPLMAAVCYGRSEIVKILLEHGANIDAQDSKGFKAEDFARKMNKKSMLDILKK